MAAGRSVGSRKLVGQRLQQLCDEVLPLDPRVRSAAVYEGEYLVAGGMRPDIPSLDPEHVAHEVDLQMYQMSRIGARWESYFGRFGTLTLTYEKLTLHTFLLGERRHLVVSAEPELPAAETATRIREVLERVWGRD